MTQGTQSRCSVTTWRDGGRKEVMGKLRRRGTHVCLGLIHVGVWQKPSQYCNYPPFNINKSNLKTNKKIKNNHF